MKVLKFGGTSVGSAQRIKNVASIICDQEQKIVVLSAMAGTTNSLVEISECFHKKDPGKANAILSALEQAYVNLGPAPMMSTDSPGSIPAMSAAQ